VSIEAKLRVVVLFGSLWAAACGGDPADRVAVVELTSLPRSPPVCLKDASILRIFTDYHSPLCSGEGCFPSCNPGATTPECPAGSACDEDDHLCEPIDCAADATLCTGGTICNELPQGETTVHRCGLPPTCADDSQCPCGSYCDADTHRCRMDCLVAQNVDLGLTCNGTLQCDTRGHCSSETGIPIPPQVVTIEPSTAALLIPRDAAGHYAATQLTVKITTTSPELGTLPGPAPAVTVTAPAAVSVACDGVAHAGGCTIAGWSFHLVGTVYVASREITVEVADASTAPEWVIDLTSAGLPQPVKVTAVPRPAQQQAGRYAGSLDLDGGAAIPIRATVTATAIELHDPAHVISPTGTVLVKVDGSLTTTSYLAGRATPALYQTDDAHFRLAQPAPTVDPVSGQLAGVITAVLASSPTTSQSWAFTLVRTGDLVTAAPCPDDERVDPAIGACIPGAAWDPATPAAPSFRHARATGWLHAMAPRLADPLLVADGAEPLAERLICFDSTLPAGAANRMLNQTKPGGLSGDLVCADPNTPHNQWAVGLVSYADRATDATKIAQYDMLAQCVQQSTRDAPTAVTTIANASCLSPERFFPALYSVAGTAPYRFDVMPGSPADDHRSRLLFTRLLQQWSQLAGFIARNGAQQRGVADLLTQLTPDASEQPLLDATPPNLSYEALLDAVDNAWTVVLDQRILLPLLALPGHAIAAPDYRQLRRPLDSWSFADREPGAVHNTGAGPALTTPSCGFSGGAMLGSASCKASAVQPRLDGNLTVHIAATSAPPVGATSTLIDSDGLVIQHVQTEAGQVLKVGHRIDDGSVEFQSFPIRFGISSLYLVRDARASTYRLYDAANDIPGGESGTHNLVARIAHYSNPPDLTSDTIYVGGHRTTAADYVKSAIRQVTIWDSALSPSEVAQLVTSGDAAIWPGPPALPADDDANAHEARVGLPVALLEGLIPTVQLIEAHVKDAALANPDACRRGHEDDALRIAMDRAARSLRIAYAIQAIAEALHDKAPAAPWQDRYALAASELAAARASALKVLANASACENPMGLGPQEFPLYFGDSKSLLTGNPPPPLLNVIEASAIFLMGKAHDANADALNALAAARSSWVQQFSSGVQQGLAGQSADQRVDDIRASFGRDLIDLCGIPIEINHQDEATVLRRFLDASDPHHLTPQNCFTGEDATCSATPSTPLSQAVPSCLRGQIGEALIAVEAARQRMQRAIVGKTAATQTQDAWFEHCAQKQDFIKGTKEMVDAVTAAETAEIDRRRSESLFSSWGNIVGGVFTSGAGLGGAIAQFALAADGYSSTLEKETVSKRALLQKRQFDGELQDCWAQAELARIPVDGTGQDIVVAVSDLRTALIRVQTLQQRVSAVVTEADAAVTREAGRVKPRLAFHYWSAENLAIYQRSLERARRLSYLALRAVEHDLQRNFGLDRDVLAATHPQQLKQTVDTVLAAELAHGYEQLVPTQHFIVLSLCNDILRLPEQNGEVSCQDPKSARRFREILMAPANALFENGAYVGQAVAFTLDPALAQISQRCAENLAQVDAEFVGDLIAAPLTLQVAKRETFSSRACTSHRAQVGGATQVGTLRSSNNLLLDGKVPQFGEDRTWTTAQVDALKNRDGFHTSDVPGPNAVPDLAGRGLYGDYRVVVPPSSVATIASRADDLRDIEVRLDYVSVSDAGGGSGVVLSPITTEMRDGAGRVIGAPNSVTASCSSGTAPSCEQGSTATITASPAAGWHFAEWSGACTGTATTCTVAMTGPRRAVATFINDDPGVALDVTRHGDSTGEGGVARGWLAVSPSGESGGTNLPLHDAVPKNAAVTLFPSPALDSVFAGWTGGGCTGTGPCTVVASAATSVAAKFTRKPTLTLTLLVDRQGQAVDGTGFEVFANGQATSLRCDNTCPSGAPATCVTTCTKAFLPGEQLAITADAAGQASFMNWGGDCLGGDAAACGVTMDADRSVTAQYKVFNHLQVTVPTNGAISLPPQITCGNGSLACSGVFSPRSAVTVTAVPAAAYKLASWTLGAGTCGAAPTCTVPMTGLTTTISASFTLSGQCAPGDTRTCCGCATGQQCCEAGSQTCDGNGNWGACGGTRCAAKGHSCN
jgi:hypothetical protein